MNLSSDSPFNTLIKRISYLLNVLSNILYFNILLILSSVDFPLNKYFDELRMYCPFTFFCSSFVRERDKEEGKKNSARFVIYFIEENSFDYGFWFLIYKYNTIISDLVWRYLLRLIFRLKCLLNQVIALKTSILDRITRKKSLS